MFTDSVLALAPVPRWRGEHAKAVDTRLSEFLVQRDLHRGGVIVHIGDGCGGEELQHRPRVGDDDDLGQAGRCRDQGSQGRQQIWVPTWGSRDGAVASTRKPS